MKLRNIFLWLSLLLIALISFSVSAAADEESLPEVTVAVCASFEPFEYIDNEGNITGIDIDIMNELCSLIGVKPVYMNSEFDTMIPAVRSPLADFAISAITITEPRSKVVSFTDPYISCRLYNPNLDRWYEESYSIPVKLSGEYLEELNTAIALLKEQGRIDEIAQKYGLTKDEEGYFIYHMPKVEAPVADTYKVSDWAESSIEFGISNYWTFPTDFDYDFTTDITREQFCEIAYNMLRDMDFVGTVNIADTSFTDTDNIKVLFLAQEGIISGKGDGSYFAPDDYLTRAEAASIMYRLARYCGLSIPQYEGSLFSDDSEIPEWAKTTVYYVVSAKIMSGTGEGFSPATTYTAEQAVSTIERLFKSIN